MIKDDDEYGAFSEMLGKINGIRRKSVSVSLCPSQISYDLTLARTRVATVRSWKSPKLRHELLRTYSL
jgi:hypothetical protein